MPDLALIIASKPYPAWPRHALAGSTKPRLTVPHSTKPHRSLFYFFETSYSKPAKPGTEVSKPLHLAGLIQDIL